MSSAPDAQRWTVLAHLLRPQGRKGEVLAELLTDFPETLRERTNLFLAKPGFSGTEADAKRIAVVNHWLPVGKNHGRIVLHFAGVDSINDAELLAGLDLILPDSERVELDEDAEYIDDLLDCVVLNGELEVGVITAVDFPTTPDGARRLPDAAPLLTVETAAGDEVLIPYVQQFVLQLSVADKRLQMKLPEGLLELNRSTGSEREADAAGEDRE